MHVERSDERDSSWEEYNPLFRVYLFHKIAPGTSWSVDTYDIRGADVLETVRWAQEQVGDDGLFSVALVGEHVDRPQQIRRGLIWLVGMDANDIPRNTAEERIQQRMVDRRGMRVVLDE